MYALIDAEGHYGDRATVYNVFNTLKEAEKAVTRWNTRGIHRVQLVRGDLTRGGKVPRCAVGTAYPRISL